MVIESGLLILPGIAYQEVGAIDKNNGGIVNMTASIIRTIV